MLAEKLGSVANLPSQIRLGLNSASSEQRGLSDLVWLHFNSLLPPCPASPNQFAVCLWCRLVLWFCFEGVCSGSTEETTTYCTYCTCTDTFHTTLKQHILKSYGQTYCMVVNEISTNRTQEQLNQIIKTTTTANHTSTPCYIIAPLTLLGWRADVDHWRKMHIKCTTLQQQQHTHI